MLIGKIKGKQARINHIKYAKSLDWFIKIMQKKKVDRRQRIENCCRPIDLAVA